MWLSFERVPARAGDKTTRRTRLFRCGPPVSHGLQNVLNINAVAQEAEGGVFLVTYRFLQSRLPAPVDRQRRDDGGPSIDNTIDTHTRRCKRLQYDCFGLTGINTIEKTTTPRRLNLPKPFINFVCTTINIEMFHFFVFVS